MKDTKKKEPVDFVITWVDGSDTAWLAKKNKYQDNKQEFRYRDWGLLPFLFRGIEQYAPWVHHVYLLTDGQVPDWLDTNCPKVTVVDHKDFIPEEYLPTFNSHVIEHNMHRIPGLASQFVYFNDDFFLMNPCKEEDFFQNGLPVDEAVLNGINGKDPVFAGIQFHNMELMNRYYSNCDIRQNCGKWLHIKYGKNVIRTILLLPFQRLQGIYNHHGPMAMLKSTYEKLWQRDGEVLREVCTHRFRTAEDVSVYIYRYEQLLSGSFVPGRIHNQYLEVDMPLSVIENAMKRAKSICLNDTDMEKFSVEKRKEELLRLFTKKFPKYSSFEKRDVG